MTCPPDGVLAGSGAAPVQRQLSSSTAKG